MEQQRILLADDDPEIREVLHLLLTSEGYLVSPAANGAQASPVALLHEDADDKHQGDKDEQNIDDSDHIGETSLQHKANSHSKFDYTICAAF